MLYEVITVMLVDELEVALRHSIDSGARIGTIFVTMGTTDAFGIDPLKRVVELRDRIEALVDYRIHVHADAVIGWPYLTFKNDPDIRQLSECLQVSIRSIVAKMAELQLADSVA